VGISVGLLVLGVVFLILAIFVVRQMRRTKLLAEMIGTMEMVGDSTISERFLQT